LAALSHEAAVLGADDGRRHARGGASIARLATAMWDRDRTYVANPRRVLQARGTALVVTDRGINVVRRGSDGAWRYAISLLSLGDTRAKKEAMAHKTREEQG
jgi:hypothetical protein